MKYIFDLDGTLYPNPKPLEHFGNAYFQAIAKHLNLSIEESIELCLPLFEQYGDSLRGFREEDLHPLEVIHAIAEEIPRFIDYDAAMSHCPKTEEFMLNLQGQKVVQSNGVRGHVEKALSCLNLHPYVDVYFGSNDLDFYSKPNPKSFQKVLDEMGWQAEDVILIEDKLANLEGAKNMGFQTVHVGWGENKYDDSHSHYVDRTYPTIIEFLEAEIAKEPEL